MEQAAIAILNLKLIYTKFIKPFYP